MAYMIHHYPSTEGSLHPNSEVHAVIFNLRSVFCLISFTKLWQQVIMKVSGHGVLILQFNLHPYLPLSSLGSILQPSHIDRRFHVN